MSEQGKTAVVFGASGVVGQALLEQLLSDQRYAAVRAAVRRPLSRGPSPKLSEIIVDLGDDAALAGVMAGADQLFCCLGTTIKKAGSRQAFREVDYALPLRLGRLAKAAGLAQFMVVTALGAKADSAVFYNRVKGELQRDLAALKLPSLNIVQPSLLLGERDESRSAESLGKIAMPLLRPLLCGPLKHYRGIQPADVARAMIDVSNSSAPGCRIHKLGEYA